MFLKNISALETNRIEQQLTNAKIALEAVEQRRMELEYPKGLASLMYRDDLLFSNPF